MKNLSNHFAEWHKNASVKLIDRRILEMEAKQAKFFPISHQPLAIHPLVVDSGEKVINYILLQSAYRYLREIALQEIIDINQVALNIVNKTYNFNISYEDSQQALSIIIDEAYHAYVALDAIDQISNVTEIKPIISVSSNPISRAFNKLNKKIDVNNFNLYQFVAVCLSEHVLTKNLVYLKQESDLNSFFAQVMKDHLNDEGRHASFFAVMLQKFWHSCDINSKKQISLFIPQFIEAFIDNADQKEFDMLLLNSLNFKPNAVNEIILDTHYAYDKNKNVVVQTFINVLKKINMLNDPTLNEALYANGFTIT